MDSTQLILIIVIVLLTLLLLALGIQVFFVLKELRKTVFKANKVLDNTDVITQSVSGPISSLSSMVSGVKTGASLISLFKKVISKDEEPKIKKKEDRSGK